MSLSQHADALLDCAHRGRRVTEYQARTVRRLTVPRERLHLHTALESRGCKINITEAGGEGDHEVQAGRGTVQLRSGQLTPQCGDHGVAAAPVPSSHQPQMAIKIPELHQVCEYQLSQRGVTKISVALGGHNGSVVAGGRQHPAHSQRGRQELGDAS